MKKTINNKAEEQPVFEEFRFKNLAGIKPVCYLSFLYLIVFLLVIYVMFLDQGLRTPQVQLRFYVLTGDASLYVDGKFYHNLNYSSDWQASTVIVPAGKRNLQIVKSGMQPWFWQQDFQANIWNNYWKPKLYSFEIQLKPAVAGSSYLWQEAWRGYLYRGLEAQTEISFDASHPYPWVLSEGLRATLYSGAALPQYWSADLQRGVASTTSMYQWGDLLTGYTLITQSYGTGGIEKEVSSAPQISLLGPRSLAILTRSAMKRFYRLQPGATSLRDSWDKGVKEDMSQAIEQAAFWQKYGAVDNLNTINKNTLAVIPESILGSSSSFGSDTTILQFDDLRFILLPGQEDIAWQQTEVSNRHFARFWFSEFGQRLQENEPIESFASVVLYQQDQKKQPWDWPEDADLKAILEDPFLQDQPVRGITWAEAQAFTVWLNKLLGNLEWELRLPNLEEHNQFSSILNLLSENNYLLSEIKQGSRLDFRIPQQPPNFADQVANILGFKGLSGSLWEWHNDDYLPYPVTKSINGNSDLGYKILSGGSWLNTLPIEEGTRDLWVDEFWQQDNELPVAGNYHTTGGQFANIRSPYTGFRLLATRRK